MKPTKLSELKAPRCSSLALSREFVLTYTHASEFALTTQNRLTATDWAHVVTLAERGDKNLRELAEQFGVTKQAIQKGLKARGITIGSRLNEVMGEVDDVAREERERKVKAANAAVEQYAKYNDAIVKLVMKRVIEGSQTPGGIAAANAEILTLKNAIATVAKAREENWEILDIKDLLGENAELPDLNVGEYTPEELERIRSANEDSYLEGINDDDDDEEDFASFGDDEDVSDDGD